MPDDGPSGDSARFGKALELVQGRTNRPLFEMWFQGLSLVGRDEKSLIIGTPNRFICRWLEEADPKSLLKACIQQAFGEDLPFTLKALPRKNATTTSATETAVSQASGAEPGASESAPPKAPDPKPDAVIRSSSRQAAKVSRSLNEPVAAQGLDPDSSVQLNPSYHFKNFIIGTCNQIAHAAGQAISQSPGKAYNPLFVHGGVGLGKTHLLQAICSELLKRPGSARILYLSCEDFVNQFIEAVEQRKLDSFRYCYRHLDVLVIDDIHFLADKERTQEEFFHTFNTLYNSQKQIVLSADSPPHEIPTLEDRLMSRFKWGLVCRLDPPEYETRVAILRAKARSRGCELPDDVTDYIATNVRSNVREIEGALTRLLVMADYSNKKELDLPFTEAALADSIQGSQRPVDFNDIIQVVCEEFQVRQSDLQSRKRTQAISRPRQLCIFLARRLTGLTLEEIGGHLGGRDHSTVLYSFEKIDRETHRKEDTRRLIDELTERVQKRKTVE